MLRIPFEWFKCVCELSESFSNASYLRSNASNPFRMVRIFIGMVRIPFEWFEFGFESFESLSNDSNLNSNASNPFQMVQMSI